jgi:hypothetical protein
MFFERVYRILNNALRLDENLIIGEILSDKNFQQFIINLNTEEQLFKEGINALNVSLESIGEGYSEFTIQEKSRKGQPTDRVTLKDTEKFYKSWKVLVKDGGFELTADPIKDGKNILERWGQDVIGLTPEHTQIVIDAIREKFIPIVLQKILA